MNFFRRGLFFLEYLIFRALAWLVNLFPLPALHGFAKAAGALLYSLLPNRRRIVLENLRAAFGDQMSEAQIRKTAVDSMSHMVLVALEFVRIPKFLRRRDITWEIRDRENLMRAWEKKRGVVILAAHLGNWELLGFALAQSGIPLHAVGRPVKNPYVSAYILKLRSLGGIVNLEKAGAVRSCIRVLKQNQIVGMLVDQHERQGGVWVDFFGRKACTTGLPAVLSLRHDVPVVETFFYRETANRFIIKFTPVFGCIRTGMDQEEDIRANTQEYVRSLEDEIRRRPSEWLWMHRRWREIPKGG